MRKYTLSLLLLCCSLLVSAQTMDITDVKAYGGAGHDIITAITSDPAGNLYVTGTSTQPLTIQGTTVNLVSAEPFMAKFNSAGTLQWFKSIAAPGFRPTLNSMVIDSENNIIACGQGAMVVKFTNTGTIIWVRRPVVNSVYTPTAVSVAVDTQNNIIFTGELHGTLTFGSTAITSLHRDYPNMYVTKYTTDGSTVFARVFKPDSYSDYSRGKAVSTDASGNIYFGAEFETSINIGAFKLTTHNISSDTPVLARLSPTTGEPVWATIVIDDEDGMQLNDLIYHNQSVYVAGKFYIQKLSASTGAVTGGMLGYNGTGAILTDLAVDDTGLISALGTYSNIGYLDETDFPEDIYGQAEDQTLFLQFRDIAKIDWYAAYDFNGSYSQYADLRLFMTTSGLNKTYIVQNFDESITWQEGKLTSPIENVDFAIVRAGAFPIKAHLTLDAVACDKQAVPFSDSSYVNLGTSSLVSREWDFGDNSAISTEANPKHLYPATGDYTVKLTVRDNANNVSKFTKKIWVAPAALPLVTQDVYTLGGMPLRLKATGNWDGYAQWYTSPTSVQPVHKSNTFDVTVQKDTVFYVQNRSQAGCLNEQVNTVKITVGPQLVAEHTRLLKFRGTGVNAVKDAADNIYATVMLDNKTYFGQTWENMGEATYSILMLKMRPDGTILWSNQITSTFLGVVTDLKMRPDGKLVVAGFFSKNISMDNITVTTDSDQEIFMALVNTETGAPEKIRRFGDWAGGNNQFPKIDVGTDNTIYFTATGNFRANATAEFHPNCCQGLLYLGKLTADLESYVWGKHLAGSYTGIYGTMGQELVRAGDRVIAGTSADDTPLLGFAMLTDGASYAGPYYRSTAGDLSSLTLGKDGNLFVLLKAKAPNYNARFGSAGGSLEISSSGHYLLSITPSFTVRWGKKIADLNYYNTQFNISRIDKDGNVYVEGEGYNLPFEQGKPQAANNFIAKYNNAGEVLWMGYMGIPEYSGKYLQLNSGKWIKLSLIDDQTLDPQAHFLQRSLYLTQVTEAEFAVTSISHPESGCLGEPVVFTANIFSRSTTTASSWLWTFGDGNSSSMQTPHYAYAQPGKYTVSVKVKDSNGNETTTTSEITIVDKPDAEVHLENGFLKAVDNAAYTYQWFRNGIAIEEGTASTFGPVSPEDQYQVRITAGACSVLSSEMLITGTEADALSGIKLYPNPTTGIVTVEIGQHHDVTVSIVDGMGKLHQESSLRADQSQLDISHLAPGLYFIRIKSGNSSVVRKLMKSSLD